MDNNIASMEEAIKRAEGMTFEKFWAALMEDRAEMREIRLETERQIRESQERTEKTLKDLSENIGGVNNRLGKLMELLFAGELWRKFDNFGYKFTEQSQNKKFTKDNNVVAEADFWLENGIYAMAVEVKTNLIERDIDNHIRRLDRIRAILDGRGDKRKLTGAIAAVSAKKDILEYAHDKGLFVFVQKGDTVKMAELPQGFKAREW